MDITSFLLGIFAITVLTAVAVVVVGMFRISRLNKELNNLERTVDTLDRIIVDNEKEIRRTIDSRVDSFGSRIEKDIHLLHERIDVIKKEIIDGDLFLHERIDGLSKTK